MTRLTDQFAQKIIAGMVTAIFLLSCWTLKTVSDTKELLATTVVTVQQHGTQIAKLDDKCEQNSRELIAHQLATLGPRR